MLLANEVENVGVDPVADKKRLFGEADAAAYTETPLPTLRHHRRKNKIKPANVGGVWVYSKAQLDDYVRNGGQTSKAPPDIVGSAEVAELLETDIVNVNYHTRVGNITGYKIGSRFVYWRKDLARIAEPGDFNIDQAVAYLAEHGVELARRTVWYHAQTGALEYKQGIDGKYFDKEQLDKFIESRQE